MNKDTTVRVFCPKCSTCADIPMGQINHLDVGGKISTDIMCPKCNVKLESPGGHYEKNSEGLLVRVGDFPK